MILPEAIKAWRQKHDKSLRDTAKDIGVSASTLCRFEDGKPLDMENFMKVMIWLTK